MKQVRNWRKLGVREVFEVLYSPVKAFKKIVEKPDFKGVVLILVLFISFAVVYRYAVYSKFFLLTETPDDDDWTESMALWASNGNLSLDDADYKVGNYSVKSSISNDKSIWMKITDIGPFDCSEDTGYEELFFWINWTHSNGTFPDSDATLRLFSVNESRYFELDLTNLISKTSGEWGNVTVNIGPQSHGWNSTNSPDWKNVTGLEFRLAWLTSANLTMQIDDLHFRKYVSSIEGAFNVSTIFSWIMDAAIEFSINWILWAGILLLVAKAFREEGGPWTTFFVIIGHVFIAAVVYTIASAALVSVLSPLNLPTKTWPPTTEAEANAVNVVFEERWYPNWAYRLYTMLHPVFIIFNMPFYFPFLREIWTMALCIVAIRLLRGITWGKAASISIVAFILRSIIRFFFGL